MNIILCNYVHLVTTDRMFVSNSSIKARRDEDNVRGKVPEVRIMMRIMRKIVVRIKVSIMRIKVRIMRKIMMRIMVGIMRIMIPDARISVTKAMDDRSNDTDGTN